MSFRFSSHTKVIISFSREEAERLGNDYIGTEHLLLGLIREGNNAAVRILKGLNVNLEELQHELESSVRSDQGFQNALPLNIEAEQAIHGAVAEAKQLRSKKVEPEHLMISILNDSTTTPKVLRHIRYS